MGPLRFVLLSKETFKYYRKNEIDVSPDEILITTGASEALTFLLTQFATQVTKLLYQNLLRKL